MNLREHVMEKIAVVEITVPAGELLELLDERDALKDRVSMLEFRLGFGVSGAPKVETIERADGSIEGGWDMGSAESYTAVEVVEPPAGDCSCKVPELSPRAKELVEAMPSTFERAVCGSRQPIGQVVESPAPLSVLKDRPFLSDKGAENSSKNVTPWSSKLTPNQTALIIRMLAEGDSGVTVAANARCLTQHVGGVMTHYRHQIEALAEIDDKREFEKFLDSLYRQMLARWVAAGKDPAVQPELPLSNKTITEAAGAYKTKGKAGKL